MAFNSASVLLRQVCFGLQLSDNYPAKSREISLHSFFVRSVGRSIGASVVCSFLIDRSVGRSVVPSFVRLIGRLFVRSLGSLARLLAPFDLSWLHILRVI